MATSVRQRFTEMVGIRMALGATGDDVRRLVLGEGLRLGGLAAAIGLVGAACTTHLLRGLLFGVPSLDPWSLSAGTVTLIGVALLASHLPARRAGRSDPGVMLRAE